MGTKISGRDRVTVALLRAIISGLGMGVLAINWLAMRHAKSIIEAIGPTPLQLLGAVFGVLQTALGIEFVLDAYRML